MDKVLGFLDNHPLLEHLDLSYYDEYRGELGLAVSLPSLRTYTQTIFGRECSLEVLNGLSLSPFCSITLRLRGRTVAEASNALPRIEYPYYLGDIERIKLRTMHDADGNEVAGMMELIGAKGTKLCLERMVSGVGGAKPLVQAANNHANNVALSLEGFDVQSMETLYIDGNELGGIRGAAVGFLKEVLVWGWNVRTLVLSRTAVQPCLSALDEDARSHSPWLILSMYTLVIYLDSGSLGPPLGILQPLSRIAQKRKSLESPLRSVSLFLRAGRGPVWGLNESLEELKRCVEELKVVVGDDALGWDGDKWFLDGLEHLQKGRCIQPEWN